MPTPSTPTTPADTSGVKQGPNGMTGYLTNPTPGNVPIHQDMGAALTQLAQTLAANDPAFANYQQSVQMVGTPDSVSPEQAQALSTKAQSTAPASSSTPTTPQSFDPLALQQMWSQVLGPAFNQAASIGANAGPNYLDAMTQAISGSNQADSAKALQLKNAQATAALMQGFAGNQAQSAVSGPAFDQLINWLQQATGAAQQAQGAAEKSIAYGGSLQNAAAFGSTSAQQQLNGGSTSNQLSPEQAAALTQQALTGTQTGSSAAGGGAVNPFLPTTLLNATGTAIPASSTLP